MAKVVKKEAEVKIEWIGRTEGNKIRFGDVECYNNIKVGKEKTLVLQRTIRMVLETPKFYKLKYHKLKVKVLKEWNK